MINNMYVGGADKFPLGTFGGTSGHFYLCYFIYLFFQFPDFNILTDSDQPGVSELLIQDQPSRYQVVNTKVI